MTITSVARAPHALGRHAEEREVLAHRRDEVALHALVLNAQQHDHVGALDRLVDRGRRPRAEPLEPGRNQRRRAAGPDLRAHGLEQQHVRPEHAAVQQVADDGDLQAGEPALVRANRERVEQRLRRVLVHAVAGVDDRRAADAREQVRRARRGVPHHDHVGRHRLEVAHGVDERLALGHARGRGRDAERVGAQALLRDLERRARARARLEEEVHDRPAAQGRHLLDGAAANLLHRLGGVEDERDLVGARGRRCRAGAATSAARRRVPACRAAGRRSALSGRSAARVVMAHPR